MSDRCSFYNKFWKDKNGKVVAWQWPNLPLWVWIATTGLGFVLPAGGIANAVSLAGKAAIIIWALIEIIWGASYFRRLLGLIVLGLSLGFLL
ncbi:MAG TPA: hypothetical protein VK534_00940 [Methylomirabilota bacterium]|nr:hypothetical protein [Methylomirabilota bacterium]